MEAEGPYQTKRLQTPEGCNVNIDSCKNSSALYGCETWSLILRGESKLRVLENRVLEVRGASRK